MEIVTEWAAALVENGRTVIYSRFAKESSADEFISKNKEKPYIKVKRTITYSRWQ